MQPTNPPLPAFGYLILGRALDATFQSLGQFFTISYLPYESSESPEVLLQKSICMWLRKDATESDILVYIIWPEQGVISLGEALSSSKPSRLITIGSTAGSRFEATTPNTIVEELLRIALRPCLLFVRWPAQPDNVLEEATRLSFTLQATQWINDLEAFLNEAAIMGDAVQSTQIHHWYRKTLGTLQTADRASFLFDPTRFLAGMLRHLHQTLLKVNHLDVNAVSRKGGPILIPVCFIRDWKENLLQEIHGNMSVIRNLLSMP